jgi:hypothetical protein
MENTLNGEKCIKLSISRLIREQHKKNFRSSFLSSTWLRQKAISRYCPLKDVIEVITKITGMIF